ncbi:hypothetical protein Phum_PHUM449680 [Pediculus humanus corporis]|uniref:Uncharacterized protein n=1 Tax=Pediculus humanus subsp. corporis TaxID=121224 RepID=E0VUE3_PEDHC|nr:uncharacterized protein Phum_PHUM449680 [Pediculus humanus corporis]EEB16999.1 hypothetical protein Phum_PHUM449680 [Pediculus humanus corporis]
MKEPATIFGYQSFILLGILSTASTTSNDNLIICGSDYTSSAPNTSIKGERSNSYDSLPCRVWNELQEKNNNKNVGFNNYSNKNDKSVVNYEKNDKIKKLVVHVPVSQNGDKYTGNDNRGGYLTYDRKNLIAEGFKRGPGFRSWGGKRDFPGLFPTDEGENFKNEEGMKKKRTRFTSWGDKDCGKLFQVINY